MKLKTLLGVTALSAATLGPAAPAPAHQTTISHGVAVTIHVAPDDEPQAGQPATINIVGARRKGWRFSIRTCRCHITVADSSRKVLFDRNVGNRHTPFTFPSSGAYRITVAGRVTRGRGTRSFNASFAYRAF